MSDFAPTQQEISNIIDPQDTTVVIVDGVTPTYKATVTSGGALLVTGSSGTFQVKDNSVAALGTDLGSIIAGYDGTNYQFLSVDSSGQLKVDTIDRAGRLLGIVYGSQGQQLKQTATNYNLQVELATNGTLYDARQIRALTAVDVITANQGGTWNINNISGTVSLPTGASTLAEQQTQTTSLQLIDDLPHLELSSITAAKGVGLLGKDGSIFRWLAVDATGALQTAIQPSPNTYFNFGDVGTSATSQVPVRRTAYTEQTTNAQRSIASANANDSSAGTGARQVKITYYNQTGSGPYTETLTMSGTAAVNTVASDICFIEKMEVTSVGSTGSNVGIITLYAATGGGGGAIGTIAATNKQTFWAHHYVASGKTMKVTGISVSHNGTTVGSGALYTLRAKIVNVATAPEVQIADFVRLYGQSSTFSRTYNSPIVVPGPSRVIMYVTPESSSSFTYRAAFDYSEA